MLLNVGTKSSEMADVVCGIIFLTDRFKAKEEFVRKTDGGTTISLFVGVEYCFDGIFSSFGYKWELTPVPKKLTMVSLHTLIHILSVSNEETCNVLITSFDLVSPVPIFVCLFVCNKILQIEFHSVPVIGLT